MPLNNENLRTTNEGTDSPYYKYEKLPDALTRPQQVQEYVGIRYKQDPTA